jgi:glycosyltransferase involved in cell wall biosynthesis
VKILWFSNGSAVPSGYGTQTRVWAPRLASLGHDVAVAAFHGLQGAPAVFDGFLTYPASGEDPWSQDTLAGHYGHHHADLLITLMDAWVLDPARLQGMNVAHWMPLDCSPLSVLDRRVLSGGGRPVAMSRFGQRQLEDAGWPGAPYVPHGIDISEWAPLPGRQEAREAAGLGDRFLIGICAANQDPYRKGFAEQFAAFAQFAADHPEALLLVHSRAQTQQGCDLYALADRCGITERVRFADQYLISAGWTPQEERARWFGMLDVLSGCSYGEGFGLPVLEAQACGTPVVVTDASAMTELCGSGWLVRGTEFWNKGHAAWWVRPSVSGIRVAYEKAHACWRNGGMAGMREQARTFALGYDADRVLTQHWKPALEELAAG